MISTAQVLAMIFSAAVSILFPVFLLVIWRKRTRAPFSAAACGAAVFFVFALVLEQLLHMLVLSNGSYVVRHTWAYVLYGAFSAGIFEETGRLVGFKFLLKKHDRKETAVMYGIGHGGTEAILLCGVSMIANLVLAFRINGAGGDVSALPAAWQTAAASLGNISAGALLIAGYERAVAICFHIALSVLVFWAVKRPGRLWLYPAAILLHAVLDVCAVLYQRGVIPNIYITEVLIGIFTLLVCIPVARLYRREWSRAENPALEVETPQENV